MEWYIAGCLTIAIVLILVVFHVPIFVSLSVASLGMLTVTLGVSSWAATSRIIFGTITEFSLVALPMFIIMGEMIAKTDFANDMFNVIAKWSRFIPGALAVTSIWVSLIFGAVIGTAAGVAAVVGYAAIPVMLKNRYSESLATGVIAGVSGLGVLIPPSVSLIVYGVVTGNSIGKLFIAGILPGVLMAILYSIYVIARTKIRPEEAPKTAACSWEERFKSLINLNMWMCFLIILLTIGSIWGGVLTPTEAGGGGSVLIIVIGLVTRQLNWGKIRKGLESAASISVRIMLIVIAAKIFSFTLTAIDVPTGLVKSVKDMNISPFMFFLMTMGIMFILGMFIDITPIILLTMPVLYVPLTSMGFDPIWLGVVTVVNMCMAVVSPPLGLSVYTVSLVTGIKSADVFMAAAPYMIIDVVGITVLYLFPEIVSWLPNTMLAAVR